eukprot:462113_1
MGFDKFISILLFIICCQSLVVDYDYDKGIRPFSYQTFGGYSMDYNDATSYINFDLTLKHSLSDKNVFVELIVIPNSNMNDIGFKKSGYLHLCCNVDLFGMYGCNEDNIDTLIIPKQLNGLYRHKIIFNQSELTIFKRIVPIKVTGIYVFALATCDSNLRSYSITNEDIITFNGTVNWIGIAPNQHNINDINCDVFSECNDEFVNCRKAVVNFENGDFCAEHSWYEYVSCVSSACCVEGNECDYLKSNEQYCSSSECIPSIDKKNKDMVTY